MGCNFATQDNIRTPSSIDQFDPIENDHFQQTGQHHQKYSHIYPNNTSAIVDEGLNENIKDQQNKAVPRKSNLNIEIICKNQSASSRFGYSKQFNFQPLISNLRNKYNKYRKNNQPSKPLNKLYDISVLKQQIRNIYVGIIKEKFVLTNDNKLTVEECKIQISENALEIQIQCLKYVMQKSGFDDGIVFFEQMSDFLKQLTGFLKTKYPRSQVIDSAQLAKQIKQINATQEYEYDMLKNAGFCFSSTDDVQITKTIKLFLNKIIDELQAAYPKFKQIIQTTFSHEKTNPNKVITTNYKIGRKISQNTTKYTRLQTGTLQVKSAQIQRVLIKWLQDLNQIILKPRQKISHKNQYKFYSIQKGQSKILFNKCTQNRCQQLIEQGLINKIQQFTLKQKLKIQEMKKQFNQFNIDMINIFNLVKHQQHQLSQQQMEVIKFSYYNNDFISWIVEEKIIQSIKILVEVGKQFNDSGFLLDLIKFKTNDLMRCQFFGNKKKIMQIYKEFQKLDKNRTLQIIKIKNRFQTTMGDAMIFFKLPQSFIICQCQLILQNQSKGQDVKKNKNIENINHFLYQLQRSPFGVLGQIGVFLKSKSQSVSAYCHVIQLSRQKSIKKCIERHKKTQVIQEQIKPFVCSKCIKFYAKFSNLFKIHQCQQCKIKICNYCMGLKFMITETLLHNQLYKRAVKFQTQFKTTQQYKAIPTLITNNEAQKKQAQHQNINQISLQKFYDRKLKQLIDNNTSINTNKGLWQVFKDKRLRLKDLFKNNKIKVQHIINYLQKQYQNQLKNDQKIMFILATWKQKQLKFKVYDYNQDENNIVNSYQLLEKYQKHQFIMVNDYDLLLQIKSFSKIKISDIKKEEKGQGMPISFFQKAIYIFDGQDKSGVIEKYRRLIDKGEHENQNYIVYFDFNPFYLIIDFDYSVKASKSQGWLQQYLKTVPDLYLFRKNIQLNNQSIHCRDLACFDNIDWVNSIKILNLNENKIINISKVLQKCINLQQLSIKQNKIKQLDFTKPLPNLKYLNASKNQSIKCVKKLFNIKNVQDIDLSDNKIQFIVIDGDDIPLIERFEVVDKKKKGHKSKTGNQEQNQQENNLNKKQQIKSNLLNPKDINQRNINKQSKQPNTKRQPSHNLAQIALLLGKKHKQIFPCLTKLNLTENRLQSLYQFSKSQFPSLVELMINDNKLIRLPLLQVPKLKKLDASFNQLINVDDLVVKSQLNNLLQINLNDNKFMRIPGFKNVAKLRKLDLSYNLIRKLDQFMKGDYPQLIEFAISQNKLTYLPKLKIPKIQRLYFDLNQIENITEFVKGEYNELKYLDLTKNLLKEMPQLSLMPSLQRLYVPQNKLVSIEEFAKFGYSNMVQVDFCYNKLSKLPAFNMPNLHKISLEQNFIENITQFSQGNYPKLTSLSISYCKTKQPSAAIKKSADSETQIMIDTGSKPTQRQTSEKDKINFSQRGQKSANESTFQTLIKQIQNTKFPSVKDYYDTFITAQQKIRGGKDFAIQAATYKAMGSMVYQQDKYQQAINYYNMALESIQKMNSQNCIDYALTLVQLCQVQVRVQNFQIAQNNFLKALQILQKLKGKQNQCYIQSMLKLAHLYAKNQQNHRALKILQQALKLQQKIKRKDSFECSFIYKKIGQCLFNQGDLNKALQSFLKCQKIQIKTKGKISQEVYQTYLKIGSVYINKGDNKMALEYYQKGLGLQKKVKGQDQEGYTNNLYSLIQLYQKQAMYKQAIQHSQKYSEIMENKGQQSLQSIEAVLALASLNMKLLTKQGYEKALSLYEKILGVQMRIIEKHEQKGRQLYQIKQQDQHLEQLKSRAQNEKQQTMPKSDVNIIKSSSNIDFSERQQNYENHAQNPLQRLLKMAQLPSQNQIQLQQQNQKILTPEQEHFKQQKRNNHFNMALTYHKIGIVFQALLRPQDALQMYQKCYQILEYIQSDQSQNCIVVLDKIGNIYYKKKLEYHNALSAYQMCLKTKQKLYGQDSNGSIVTLQLLGEISMKLRMYEEGQSYYSKCLKFQLSLYPQTAQQVIATYFKIGQCLIKLKNYQKSLQYFQKCLKLYEQTKGKQSIQTAQTLQKMGQIYDHQFVNNKTTITTLQRCLALKIKLKGHQCPSLIRTYCSLSKVFIDQKNYDKSTDYINKCLKIIDANKGANYSEESILYWNLGKIALLDKNPFNQKAIQMFEKAIHIYQTQNVYIFVVLQTVDMFSALSVGINQQKRINTQQLIMKLHQPFYPLLLEMLSDCYHVENQKVKSFEKIKQAFDILKVTKGLENEQTKRIQSKMLKVSGQKFVTEIVGDGPASRSKPGVYIQKESQKQSKDIQNLKRKIMNN